MLIRNLKISRLLSFGPEGIDLPMRPLNVLIGANGCGKSNFVEVLNVLRYAPVRFDSPIMTGGGAKEWMWKGGDAELRQFACIEAEVTGDLSDQLIGFRHRIHFGPAGGQVLVDRESISYGNPTSDDEGVARYYYYENGNAAIQDGQSPKRKAKLREMDSSKMDSRVSILSQIRDPENY
jgi:predicted ATPase